MIDHSQMKTGRHPANLAKVAAHIQARDVIDLSKSFSRPAAQDWSTVDGSPLDYPIFANDRLGCCVFASAAHSQITQSANSGVEVAITEDQVVDAYSRFAGYVPGDASTDNGASMLDVGLRSMKGEQIAGNTMATFVAINPKDDDMVYAAAAFFGGLWMGWDLPNAWKGADVWDVAPDGSTSGKWERRSWGGHATACVSYSPMIDELITWAAGKPITRAARYTYCEELYAVMWSGLWARLEGGLCPAGLDMQKLNDLSKQLGV